MTKSPAMPVVYLKKDRSYPFLNHHPWLFAGAIHHLDGKPEDGDEVKVCGAEGSFIAYGLFNSRSQIRVRLYSWKEELHLTEDYWTLLLRNAISLRRDVLLQLGSQDAMRLVSSEGDGISGLTVDLYSGYLVVQFTSLALYLRKEIFLSILNELMNPLGIYLRTEKDIREEEGLEAKDGLLFGSEPESPLLIKENHIEFEVLLQTGQKTGFYLDQRENRLLTRQFAKGRKCLDMCCYTGGFALNMAAGGAESILAVDVSVSALEVAERNASRNAYRQIQFMKGDAFKTLQHLQTSGEKFDMIVLDPPKFSRSKAAQKQALSGYRNLNQLAMTLLNPQGILFTCSCSGRVSREDFMQVLMESAKVADVNFQILEQRGAAADHPVSVYCPESQYLKCVVGTVNRVKN